METRMTDSLPPRIVFTTPSNYADRLSGILHLKVNPPPPSPPPLILWSPTVIVESTPRTQQSLKPHLSSLQDFSAIAFTSRTGITSFSDILFNQHFSPLPRPESHSLIISALGKDAELLTPHYISKLCGDVDAKAVKILVPPVATPLCMVESLGLGNGRRVLCPVPEVIGLHEPSVVPDFLQALADKGWVPVRVSAYETRWAGPNCASPLVEEEGVGRLEAILFTSTAEVEGLLKSLKELGFEWEMVRKRWPGLVVAAHGPVTAAGANNLGVNVDVVGSRFGSFDGIVEALALKLGYRH